MKQILPWCLAISFLAICNPALSAEDSGKAEAEKMTIESIIASCEEQYTVETYPDAEERNKLIDQCIEDNSAALKEKE